ncbi:hypothetical protein Plo01_66590 [Planobispora longispora]|uniref:Uncharacterized protein n=1 Tax=Planobispora longispora TaxID=28887 RepID=A0A8J3RT41_9ACTN|nr:hypothetical protein Plo01_66590 [Planobispora longispora]
METKADAHSTTVTPAAASARRSVRDSTKVFWSMSGTLEAAPFGSHRIIPSLPRHSPSRRVATGCPERQDRILRFQDLR